MNSVKDLIKKTIVGFLAMLLVMVSYANQKTNAKSFEDENDYTIKVISEMPWEEQIAMLTEYGVVFPDNFPADLHRDFIQSVICLSEKDVNYRVVANSPVTFSVGCEIVSAVNKYLGRESSIKDSSFSYGATRGLNDSTVVGSWSNSYYNYNCYAYAVGMTDAFYWPGMYSNVPNSSNFDISVSISTLAAHVKNDLASSHYSYNCIKVVSTRPTSFQSGQKCICIRKGSDDFHFMKLSSGFWYHKPSWTNPLKYKYTPSNSTYWTNEAYAKDPSTGVMTYYSASTQYTSNIRYIVYSTTHTTNYGWTGESYHSGSYHYYKYGDICQECGTVLNPVWIKRPCSGPPCSEPTGHNPIGESV